MSERRKHLEFLRKTAREAIWSGDYERALTLYDDGLSLARAWKDRERWPDVLKRRFADYGMAEVTAFIGRVSLIVAQRSLEVSHPSA